MGSRNAADGQTWGPTRIGVCVPEHEGSGYMPPNSIGAIPSSFPGVSKILAKVTESETVLICDPPLTSYASSPSSLSVCIQKIRLQIRQTPAPQTVFCESLVLRGYSAEITQAWETLHPTLSKVHSAHQHVLQETTCSSQLSYVVPTVFDHGSSSTTMLPV